MRRSNSLDDGRQIQFTSKCLYYMRPKLLTVERYSCSLVSWLDASAEGGLPQEEAVGGTATAGGAAEALGAAGSAVPDENSV